MEDLLLDFSRSTGIYSIMGSPWGWPIVESLHFVGLCLLIGSVGLFDLRMLGLGKGIPMSALHKLVPLGILGFGINVITGTMFFTTAPDQYLYNPAFQMKILFMMAAGVNMAVFYRYVFQDVKAAGPQARAGRNASIIAAVSLVCWVSVITAGRLITFFRPPAHYWCFWCG